MNGWTHFSVWRLWFTCKAAANSQAPSSEISFPLRLQNVREQKMRGGSTNLFTLCKVYLISVPHYWDTVSDTVLNITVCIHKSTLWALCLFCLDYEFNISEADLWQLYLALYVDSWWVGRKRAWNILFVHAHNHLLLNICSSNSRGENMHSHWGCRKCFKKCQWTQLYLNKSIQGR